MIRNGLRPTPAQFRNPLGRLADQLAEASGRIEEGHRALSLLTDTVLPLIRHVEASRAEGSLQQLGNSLVLPLTSGGIRYPTEISMQTNGILGNHFEVRYAAGSYSFTGRDRHFLSNMVDGDLSSWTEVEAYRLDDDMLRLTRGYGFQSEEGLSWLLQPGEDLEWTMEITLPEGTNRYVCISSPTSLPRPMIDRILSGTDVIQSHVPLHSTAIIPLRGAANRILLRLRQSTPYRVMIGHGYNYEIMTPTREVFSSMDIRRVPGPYPSLRSVGLLVSPDGQVLWPTLTTQPKTYPERPDSPIETLPAWRYVIAVSEIAFLSGEFAESGEAILGPFSWPDTPSRIRLQADVRIPPEWGPEPWVEMAISGDRTRWYPISPDGTTAPREYAIGSILVQEEIPVLPLAGQKIWLRIRMRRPAEDSAQTPVVSDIRLTGEV